MKRFIAGTDRGQSTLFPECLEDWIGDDNAVRVIDVFVEELDLGELGFGGVDPEATGRPSYHPSMLLKLYIYGGVYLIGANFSRARARRSRATRSSRLGGASPISFSSNSFSRYSNSGADDGARAFGADADDDGVAAAAPASYGVIANRRH